MSYPLATRRSTRRTRGIHTLHSPVAQTTKKRRLAAEQASWVFRLPDDLWTIVRDLVGAEEAGRFALTCRQSLALVRGPAFWQLFEQPVFVFSNPQHRRILRFFTRGCAQSGQPLRRLVLAQPYYRDRTGWLDYQGYSLHEITVETLVLQGQNDSDQSRQEHRVLDEFGRLDNLVARGTTNICLSLRNQQHAQTLRSLVISSQRVADNSLRALQELRQLQSLALHDCGQLTDQGLAWLARVPQLKKLCLASCHGIHGSNLQNLSLTGLTLRDLPPAATNILQRLPATLQELDLLGFRPLLPAEVRLLDPSLRRLRLALGPHASDELLDEVGSLRGLQALCLSRCTDITPAGLAKLRRCPALQELRLGQANRFASLRALHAWPSLYVLKLWHCGVSTPGSLFRSIPAGLAGCAHLQKLVLGCYNLTDAALSGLRRCPALQELELQWCYFGGDLSELRHCQSLQKLTLSECQLSPASLLQLRQARPDLHLETRSFPTSEDPWEA